MKILYFGNKFLEQDNLAVKICERLKQEMQNIEFKEIKNTFQLIDEDLEDFILIDVVQDLKDVKWINVDDLKVDKISTIHDFDLGFFLKLKNKDVKILGIPQDGCFDRILNGVRKIILSTLC